VTASGTDVTGGHRVGRGAPQVATNFVCDGSWCPVHAPVRQKCFVVTYCLLSQDIEAE
jgi:hypothetical protein